MAKPQTEYVCNECGAKSRQYFGKCSGCGSWNSLVEQVVAVTVSPKASSRSRSPHGLNPAQPRVSLRLDDIVDYPQSRIASGYPELDRVLGGGIVPGSLVLIGGDPGIGKSTLLLQVAQQLSQRHSVLYACAEESGQQVKMRWQRLAPPIAQPQPSVMPDSTGPRGELTAGQLYLLPEIEVETIVAELESLRPQLAIIDSIQAIYYTALNSAPGSVAQVRECTATLMRVAKRLEIALMLVGHVTKEGAIAGPKVLEHLVDTVLYFEGDRFASHRLLRSVKNRFGATHELGVFEMRDRGLVEVDNPSALFLGSRDESTPGTAVIVACEGTRPLVVELQALVSPTSYSSPRRSATGLEYNRLLQILAVLEKRVGFPLSKFDAYVASAGGLNVAEPAADLGVAVAIAASFRDRSVQRDTVLIGEVGLGGQVRSVSQMELRLREAAKLGFRQAIVPKGQELHNLGLTVIGVSKVVDAIATVLSGPETTQERPQ
ncbi:DNA repair protein RadA [Prochlorothrix hollandica]|uniref:DNA repair protein RadA n=1 Tax=Prochlorothrix hollandica PCC 9006 = CALU 1027 TaxID=317619 RepID=A0A0M2Q4H4_PROHO|nr:DNA repair protein RadA [Prochlorothrix hollandica]KKJ01477.1 DNA repair protein RadA [Prochlorothrix hollandica PCC 9006 = CALU 1027]